MIRRPEPAAPRIRAWADLQGYYELTGRLRKGRMVCWRGSDPPRLTVIGRVRRATRFRRAKERNSRKGNPGQSQHQSGVLHTL
jgi:hypothetical protein